eukprot:11184268-Alexandrium_andersonii.AAC.1
MEAGGHAESPRGRPGPEPRAGALWRLSSLGPGRSGPGRRLVAGVGRSRCFRRASRARSGLPGVVRL